MLFVTYRTQDNQQGVQAVQDKKLLDGIRPGDRVEVTLTRARALSIERKRRKQTLAHRRGAEKNLREGGAVPTVQEAILNAFSAKLSKSPTIDRALAEALRKTLTSAKKLKVDDLVGLLTKDPTDGTP